MKIATVIMLLLFISCRTKQNDKTIGISVMSDSDLYYCLILDSIYNDIYILHSNIYLNKYIPEIEIESKVPSSSQKGTTGYWYQSDSIFLIDYKKWKEYFKCDS
jgi:hypothetical protein